MSDVKLSVGIMAHKKRANLLPKLCSRLGVPADVITFDRIGCRWETGRRTLLSFDPEATHHIVVQDDAVPAKDLLAAVESWIPRLPDGVLCLYAGRVREFNLIIRQAKPPQPSWLQMRKINWGVALVFPTKYIPAIVEYGDNRTEIANYDMRMSEWCVLNDVPVLYPYPSWVNHETTSSLVPGRSAYRKALTSLTYRQSALQWDPKNKARVVPISDFTRRSEMAYPLLHAR